MTFSFTSTSVAPAESIGIIGAGGIAQALLGHLAAAGYRVTISNSRGPASLAELVAEYGANVTAGTVAQAAAADVVIVAVPWNRLEGALAGLPPLTGRIVIDTTNPLFAPLYQLVDLGGLTSSEVVAKLVPGARVVKAFNTLPPPTLSAAPQQAGGRRVIFISGDDAAAKATVNGIIARLGFAGVDLGGLVAGGTLHQFPGGPLPGLNLIQLPA